MNDYEKLQRIAETIRRYRELYDEGRITYEEFCLLKDARLSSPETETGELKPPEPEQRG